MYDDLCAAPLYVWQGCELVIALTHMRWPNDTRLAREAPEVDLVLGGHDHDFHYEQVPGPRRPAPPRCNCFLPHVTSRHFSSIVPFPFLPFPLLSFECASGDRCSRCVLRV